MLREHYRASPFLTFSWFDAAWLWAVEFGKPMILCAHDGVRLVGACPLLRKNSVPIVGRRVLTWLAVPDTHECDVICAYSHSRQALRAMANEIRRRRRDWDILELCFLDPEARNARTLALALTESGVATRVEPDDRNTCVELVGTWDEFHSKRSRSFRKAINLAANRIARAGRVRIAQTTSRTSNSGDVDQALEEAIRISAQSWKAGLGTTLDKSGPGQFIRRLAKIEEFEGCLSIWMLYLNDRPVASEIQLAQDHVVHALRADFDPAFESASPGANLNVAILKALFSSDARRYLMGPGPNPYKQRWGDSEIPLYRILAFSPAVRGRVIGWIDSRLRPRLRRLRRPTWNATTSPSERP
jgi:CelD/BcsL family acetyltransferase involved in cellulose biosynthesis